MAIPVKLACVPRSDDEKVETPETVNASISAVPFMNRSFHCFEDDPKLKRSSVVGIRFDANSPPTTTSSVSASPILIVPPRNVTIPINSDWPATNRLPVIVVAPPTFRSLVTVATPVTASTPPTYKFFSTPTPPSTIRAPVSTLTD